MINNSPYLICRHTFKYLVQLRQSPLLDQGFDSHAKRGRLNVSRGLAICYVGLVLISTCGVEPINLFANMCFGKSSYEGHSSHARPVELQPQRPIRQVVPLEGLNYYATKLRQGDNPVYDPGSGHLIDFFTIRHLNQPEDDERYIAILGGCEAMGLLYGQIYPLISLSL